ncbi:hypothetical protein [Phytopseudomonas dryadis]|uniref:Uncharacterized protein n=1 Tax=Phytopseudomonas dryadis TaxID=2487520 RepID=A0A4Q9R0D3_9GAMM|nr:hypothetical protein [Pseudomonas dryadis]TBU90880.1 hypothetical protein DNK44_14570 [Pseudomonas dryadis]
MGQAGQAENKGDPYGQLLQRLTSALHEADSLARLSDEPSSELEVRGLSASELAMIRAYLANDRDWLRIWHTAAAEQVSAAGAGVAPPFRRRAVLCCRGCGAALTPHGCPTCGCPR